MSERDLARLQARIDASINRAKASLSLQHAHSEKVNALCSKQRQDFTMALHNADMSLLPRQQRTPARDSRIPQMTQPKVRHESNGKKPLRTSEHHKEIANSLSDIADVHQTLPQRLPGLKDINYEEATIEELEQHIHAQQILMKDKIRVLMGIAMKPSSSKTLFTADNAR